MKNHNLTSEAFAFAAVGLATLINLYEANAQQARERADYPSEGVWEKMRVSAGKALEELTA